MSIFLIGINIEEHSMHSLKTVVEQLLIYWLLYNHTSLYEEENLEK